VYPVWDRAVYLCYSLKITVNRNCKHPMRKSLRTSIRVCD